MLGARPVLALAMWGVAGRLLAAGLRSPDKWLRLAKRALLAALLMANRAGSVAALLLPLLLDLHGRKYAIRVSRCDHTYGHLLLVAWCAGQAYQK